jgi:hypothetical protein
VDYFPLFVFLFPSLLSSGWKEEREERKKKRMRDYHENNTRITNGANSNRQPSLHTIGKKKKK